jgi:predicted lipid-binding transport protein (Tim44 family)
VKKILLFAFLLLFAVQSIGLAAVSGSKGSSAPKSSPAVSRPAAAPTSPNTAPGYKPSAPAKSYNDKAPAAAPKSQQAAQPSTGSSFLRNAAMIGGGMLLGSMLGNMFGFGANGMFAEIIGVLFNLMLVFLVVFGLRYAWTRYQANKAKKENENPYRR